MYVNQVYMGSSALTEKENEKKKNIYIYIYKKVDVISTVTSTCDREWSSPMLTFGHHRDNLIF